VSSRPRPILRKATATRLRSLADRFDPRLVVRDQPAAAPLVRIGGRWWRRDELVDGTPPRD